MALLSIASNNERKQARPLETRRFTFERYGDA